MGQEGDHPATFSRGRMCVERDGVCLKKNWILYRIKCPLKVMQTHIHLIPLPEILGNNFLCCEHCIFTGNCTPVSRLVDVRQAGLQENQF